MKTHGTPARLPRAVPPRGSARRPRARDPKQSGGAQAANPREGFRNETLARFALSAFGPATDVEVEDDHGIDLVCATARKVGKRLHVGPGYVVQVKPDSQAVVPYGGPHARTWLNDLGNPLLICRVNQKTTRVRLYSTWNLSRLLFHFHAWGGPEPRHFRLRPEDPVTTDEPTADRVPLGAPIVDFYVTQLHDSAFRDRLRECIEQWVKLDAENIVRRRLGLAIAKGYTEWVPNTPPNEHHVFYKPYFFGPAASARARAIIVECATIVAIGEERDKTDPKTRDETAALKAYVGRFCDLASLDKWERGILGLSSTNET